MTSPPERITVVCPECGIEYEDWMRSVNLDLDDFGADYLRECSTATCPRCAHVVELDTLVVEGDVWTLGRGAEQERKPLDPNSNTVGQDWIRGGLDPESRRFQQEADDLVRRWAGDDEYQYWHRWRQLGNWSMNRTQGDAVRKSALKRQLMATTGGRCMGTCGRVYDAPQLAMHRLDVGLAHSKAANFGYVEENVKLLCASCHDAREAERRDNDAR